MLKLDLFLGRCFQAKFCVLSLISDVGTGEDDSALNIGATSFILDDDQEQRYDGRYHPMHPDDLSQGWQSLR